MTSQRPGQRTRNGWALAVIAMAQFVVIMDTSIIGVALPQMQEELGFTQENLSWVFNAYVIAFGGLLLLGGKLSDLLGARRIFATGWVVLGAGSLVAGVAGSVAVEITGRAVQGVGAALIAPSALTLLMMLFGSDQKELTKAMALYAAAAPAGGTAGVFLGGVLTEFLSWPWVFFINIPVAVVALAGVKALMPASAPRPGSVDLPGALFATGGLATAVFGIVEAPEVGWDATSTIVTFVIAAVLLGAFVALQATRREPLMHLSIFKTPNLAAANIVQLLLGAAWIPMWFFLNLYLQQVLGYGPFASGSALLPMTLLIMLGMITVAPRAIARYGPKTTAVAGLAVLAAGLVWLAQIRPDGNFWVDVLPASLIAAAGMSLAFIPSLMTAVSSARPEEGGLASGIVNTNYQVGSALGLAIITALAATQGAGDIGNPLALTEGFSAAFVAAAVTAGLGAAFGVLGWRKVTSRRSVQ